MKKRSFLFLLVLFCSIFILTSCGDGGADIPTDVPSQPTPPGDPTLPPTLEHDHTFSNEWDSDEEYHWYNATCEHTNLVSSKEEHNWEVEVMVDPTCKAEGAILYTCVCGKEKTETIPVLEHNVVVDEKKDPTCTTPGLTEGSHCDLCGDTLVEQEEIKANDHDVNDVEVYGYDEENHWRICATCNEPVLIENHTLESKLESIDGEVKYATRCYCGYELIESLGENKAYNVDNEDDLRLLLTNGYDVVLAADIQLTSSIFMTGDVEATVDLAGHTVIVGWVDKENYAEVFRTDNGAILTIKGNGDIYGGSGSYCNGAISTSGGVINIYGGYFSAGLTADGINGSDLIYARSNGVINIYGGKFKATPFEGKYYTLDILESEIASGENGVINVYGGEFVGFNPANHSNDGIYNNKLGSNEYHSIILEAIDSVFTYKVEKHAYEPKTTDPSCTEAGYTTYTCKCKDKYVVEGEKAYGHSYAEEVTEPTCLDSGYTTFTCKKCNDSYVGDEVDALGHDYHSDITLPTCTETGYITYTCLVCEDSYIGDEREANGHAYDAVVTEATCQSGGYTTYTCSVCGDSYVGAHTEATPHLLEANYQTGKGTCLVCGTTDIQLELSNSSLPGSFNSWSFTSMYKVSDEIVRIDYVLEAGTYEFKVVKDAKWDNAYGNNGTIIGSTWITSQSGWEMTLGYGNCTLEAKVAGTYTFEFNTKTKSIMVSGPMSVIGSMDEAIWAVDHYMTYQGNGVYEVELDLEAGSYEFKVRANGAWDNSWGQNLDSVNMTLNANFSGKYLIIINFVNKTLSYDSINEGA